MISSRKGIEIVPCSPSQLLYYAVVSFTCFIVTPLGASRDDDPVWVAKKTTHLHARFEGNFEPKTSRTDVLLKAP